MNIKIEYWNDRGDVGDILYQLDRGSFRNRIILPPDVEVETIGYEIDEVEQERSDGTPEITEQLYRKTYSLRYLCDWSLADAMSLIKMHDSVFIKLKGEEFQKAERVDIDIDTAEAPGHAVVVLTFSFAWIFKTLCGHQLIKPEMPEVIHPNNDGYGLYDTGNPTGAVDNTSEQMIAGSLGTGSEIAFVRFENIALANGQKVHSAMLELWADATELESLLSVYGVLIDEAPLTNEDIYENFTSQQLVFTLPAADEGDKLLVYDLASVIEEIISQSGWVSGNSITLALYTGGSSPDRTFKTIEGGNPARLIIVAEESKTEPIWKNYGGSYNQSYS